MSRHRLEMLAMTALTIGLSAAECYAAPGTLNCNISVSSADNAQLNCSANNVADAYGNRRDLSWRASNRGVPGTWSSPCTVQGDTTSCAPMTKDIKLWISNTLNSEFRKQFNSLPGSVSGSYTIGSYNRQDREGREAKTKFGPDSVMVRLPSMIIGGRSPAGEAPIGMDGPPIGVTPPLPIGPPAQCGPAGTIAIHGCPSPTPSPAPCRQYPLSPEDRALVQQEIDSYRASAASWTSTKASHQQTFSSGRCDTPNPTIPLSDCTQILRAINGAQRNIDSWTTAANRAEAELNAPLCTPINTDNVTTRSTCTLNGGLGNVNSYTVENCVGDGEGSLGAGPFHFNFGRRRLPTVQTTACDLHDAIKRQARTEELSLLTARGTPVSNLLIDVSVSGTFQWHVGGSMFLCFPIQCPLVAAGTDCSGPTPSPSPGPGPSPGGTRSISGGGSCINDAVNNIVNANNSNTNNLMALAGQVGGATQQAIQNLNSQVSACVNQRTLTPCTPPTDTSTQQNQITNINQQITTKQSALTTLDGQITAKQQQATNLQAQSMLLWQQCQATGQNPTSQPCRDYQTVMNQWTALQGELGPLTGQRQQLTQDINMLQMQKQMLQQQIQQMQCSKSTISYRDCSSILSDAVPSFAGPQQAAIQNASMMLNTAYMNLAMCGQGQ